MSAFTNVTHKRKHICNTKDVNIPDAMSALSKDIDIGAFKSRVHFPERVHLVNTDTGPRGACIKRDGVVLGRHPGCTIPSEFDGAEHVLISFFLHHDIGPDAMKIFLGKNPKGEDNFKPPIFQDSSNSEFDTRTSVDFPIRSNQQWISSGLTQVHWKKKSWPLSGHMRKIAEVKHPQWVIVMTPKENGILQYAKSVRSAPFEVRSKDQPKQSAFAAGRTVAKRRTPETFRAEQALKSEQADILKLSDSIRVKTAQHEEYRKRLQLALDIAQSDPNCQHLIDEIRKYMQFHKM